MKRFTGLFVVGLIVVASSLASNSASAASIADKTSVKRYIVTLKAGVNPRSVASIAGVEPTFVYDAALNGFAVELNQGQLQALRLHSSVVSIEPDGDVLLSSASGGDNASQPSSTTIGPINAASNVSAYVIDTGIATSHPEFGGRATNVYDALGGTGADCNGHGTFTAGVIGGAIYGVAKDVKLRGVRVLDCNGSGSWSGVFAGINYVANSAIKPAVANFGLSGTANSSLDTAAENMVNRGVVTVVPAGNSSADACNFSPGRVPSMITVGASTTGNTKAPYSNYGPCVDIYAPGTRTAAWLSGTMTHSGTDVAAAYVAGCVAKYQGLNPNATPAQVSSWLITNSQLVGGLRIFTCPI